MESTRYVARCRQPERIHPNTPRHILWIKSLPPWVKDIHLNDIMEDVGATHWTVFKHISNNNPGKTTCWAKVQFQSQDDKELALGQIISFNGYELDWSKEPSCTMCGEIGHLGKDCSREPNKLTQRFAPQGITKKIGFNSLFTAPAQSKNRTQGVHSPAKETAPTNNSISGLTAPDIIKLVQTTMQACIADTIKAVMAEIIPAIKTSITQEIQAIIKDEKEREFSPFQRTLAGSESGFKRKKKLTKITPKQVLPSDAFSFLSSESIEIMPTDPEFSDPPYSAISSFLISSSISLTEHEA